MTNIVKEIFIIPTKDIQNNASGCEKVLTLQKPVQILKKKIQKINPRKILCKVTKYHEIWMSY